MAVVINDFEVLPEPAQQPARSAPAAQPAQDPPDVERAIDAMRRRADRVRAH